MITAGCVALELSARRNSTGSRPPQSVWLSAHHTDALVCCPPGFFLSFFLRRCAPAERSNKCLHVWVGEKKKAATDRRLFSLKE